MMSKMDTLNETELRGLASCHLMGNLLDKCESWGGRIRVRSMTFDVNPWLWDDAYRSVEVRGGSGTKEAHRRCCPAIVAHWLKASDR